MFSPILSTSSNGDRNILFSALAMQLDYLAPERFTETWRDWKSQTLMPWPDFLVARSHLSTDERQTLERLMERKLSKHDGHVEACLEDLAGQRARRALAAVAPGWGATSVAHGDSGKTKEHNGRAGVGPAPDRVRVGQSWWEHLRASLAGKFRGGRALIAGGAALLVLGAIAILLMQPEGPGEGKRRVDDGASTLPKLQHRLPVVGMPVPQELLQANDQERAELYPLFLARAQEDWQNGRLREARAILEQQQPPRMESRDVRSFEWYYLHRLYTGSRFDFPTGPGALSGLTYTPDGTRMITVSNGGRVKVWDVASGELIRSWDCNSGLINAVAFSGDGRQLVAATRGNAIKVWDVASAVPIRTIQATPEGVLRDLAIRPDGRQCAAGGSDQTIILWDLTTGAEVASFRGHSKGVMSVAYSADGQVLASASLDGTVRLWRAVEGGGEIRSIQLSESPGVGPCKVLFSPDGTRLTACSGNVLQVWDTASGENIANFKGHKVGPIHTFCFSPDGTRVVSAATDGFMRIWETTTGAELLSLLTGSATLFTFSPDGTSLAAQVRDPQLSSFVGETAVAIWETRPPTPKQQDRREALGIVEQLFRKTVDRKEVANLVRKDSWLSASVRTAALSFAETLELDPLVLNNSSWGIVREPSLNVEAYTRALHQAEEAVRKVPTIGAYVNTLGVAQYRVGRYDEALKTLLRSSRLNITQPPLGEAVPILKPGRRPPRSNLPSDVAFLAMTYYRLGRFDDARKDLSLLRSIMEQQAQAPEREGEETASRELYQESLEFLHEAEALIDKPSQ